MGNSKRLEFFSCQRSARLLWLSTLILTVSISEANYNFTVHFHEFNNPLGLQCAECGSGGPPACCDNVQRFENCNMSRPFTCDTRFRFMLRPFGEPVETAPNGGFPYFNRGNGGNSEVFNEGPLFDLPNPFTITRNEAWTGRIQFFIDALDNDVNMATSGISETEVIINRFPIDLELNPGPSFTERTTYTGIYNISDLGFDMSFRVQCLDNYFGPSCTTFCESVEGVYTCDSEGRPICLQANRDPDTNCTSCLTGYDPEQNCTQCLLGRTLSSGCSQCPPGYDILTDCTTCLSGYEFTSNQCSRITTPPPPTTVLVERAESSGGGGANLTAVSGVVGAIAIILVILLVVLSVIVVVMVIQLRRQRQEKIIASGGEDEGEEGTTGAEHDFENPLYVEGTQGDQANGNRESPHKVDLSTEIEDSHPIDEPIEGLGSKEGVDGDVTQNANQTTADEEPTHEGDDHAPQEIDTPLIGSTSASGSAPSNQSAGKSTEYADIIISPATSLGPQDTTAQSTSGLPEHEYASAELTKQSDESSEAMQQSSATYTNTTPGVITQEALGHYDFGQ